MKSTPGQFDERAEPRLPAGLAEELDRLYRPPFSVPPEVERRILDEAWRHCEDVKSRRRVHRWARVGAAAAVLFVGVWLYNAAQPSRQLPPAVSPLAGVRDLDRSGRVDILDAFGLAKRIERQEPLDPTWDLNGDGMVTQADVDALAMTAVRLDGGA